MGVCIVGWGHSPFGRLDALDLEALITSVLRDALAHAALSAHDVNAIWLGNLNGGLVPDIFCSSMVLQADEGLRWKPATRVENACASGAAAVYSACEAIESGSCRIALVVGAEKMTAVSGAEVTRQCSSYFQMSQLQPVSNVPVSVLLLFLRGLTNNAAAPRNKVQEQGRYSIALLLARSEFWAAQFLQ